MENILSIGQVVANGVPTLDSTNHNISENNIVLTGEFVNPKYHRFLVKTSVDTLEKQLKVIKDRPMELNKRIWLAILRNLNQYDETTLASHADNNTQEWKNWCDDIALWYCYNAVVFNKGIPVMPVKKEEPEEEEEEEEDPKTKPCSCGCEVIGGSCEKGLRIDNGEESEDEE